MYIVQSLCVPVNGLVPEIQRLEMLVVKNKLIINMGILQCCHLVALSNLELKALRSAMYGITQDAWLLTHPQIIAVSVSACRIRIVAGC